MSVDVSRELPQDSLRKLSAREWDDLIVAIETRPVGVTVHQLTGARGVSVQRLYKIRSRRLPALIASGRLSGTQRRSTGMSSEEWDAFLDRVDSDRSKTVEQHCAEIGVSRSRYYQVIARREIKAKREADGQ